MSTTFAPPSLTLLTTFGATSLTLSTVLVPVSLALLTTFLASSGATSLTLSTTLSATFAAAFAPGTTSVLVTIVESSDFGLLTTLNICFLISAALGALTLVVVALPSTPARNSPLAVFIVSPGFAVCTAFLVEVFAVVVVAFATTLMPVGGTAASFGVGILAVFF